MVIKRYKTKKCKPISTTMSICMIQENMITGYGVLHNDILHPCSVFEYQLQWCYPYSID